jgi:hypothetical protein
MRSGVTQRIPTCLEHIRLEDLNIGKESRFWNLFKECHKLAHIKEALDYLTPATVANMCQIMSGEPCVVPHEPNIKVL